MDKAIKFFDDFIKVRITATQKVLFCIYRHLLTPREIIAATGIKKTNVAKYCKSLIAYNMITSSRTGKNIMYEITGKGKDEIKKVLEKINEII